MLLYFLYFTLSSLTSLAVAKKIKNHPQKIIDFVHDKLPEIRSKYLSDVLIFLQLSLSLLYSNKESLSDTLLIMGSCYFLRCLTMFSTVLPPLKHSENKIRFGGANGSGTEYIFSGHACWSCISFINLYNITPKYISIPYNIVSQMIVIMSRNHYTVDVILGWIITYSLYFNLYFFKKNGYKYN
jgi:hypothetical protein